ncbi:MAG: hypothetical protein ABSH20_19245 [Tepidisphaeraceae bacterium]|jgi:dienelactone hydrolase
MRHIAFALVSVLLSVSTLAQVADPRLGKPRTLYEGSNFTPPATREAWEQRAGPLRTQLLVAAGLWPLPEKTPLNAVIHSPIQRDGYTVEKVYFQSYPGFYVTGNLYRAVGKTGPLPAVLSPHGHWENGRFYRAPDKDVEKALKGGWETDTDAARYPLQARCANLARLGCIVFHYDMVGYADNDATFPHRKTWLDADSQMRGLNMLGLQLWDSIRTMDFVLSLPDVDRTRIACTGASGGATQTFLMMAVDSRLTVAAPVCMISAGNHQGGCVCENAPLLRIGTDNVEISCLFAPKPFVHPTATGDWTAHYLEEGYPQTQAIYRLYGTEGNVHSERFTADHNYNKNSRQVVYNFLNKHLKLGAAEPVAEQTFTPIEPKDLAVFDATHPRPTDWTTPDKLEDYLVKQHAAQIGALSPRDAAGNTRVQQVLRPALRAMVASELPQAGRPLGLKPPVEGKRAWRAEIQRPGGSERLPANVFLPAKAPSAVTILLSDSGKDAFGKLERPGDLVEQLLARGHAVIAADVFLTGELRPEKLPDWSKIEFIHGYNRSTIGNRVHDVLTLIARCRTESGISNVNLVGLGKAGIWCLLARTLADDAVSHCVAETGTFDFDQVTSITDEQFLPPAMRYGGLWPLAAAGGTRPLMVVGRETPPQWLAEVYKAAGQTENLKSNSKADNSQIVEWLGR